MHRHVSHIHGVLMAAVLAALVLTAVPAQAMTINMLDAAIGGHPDHQGRNKNRWGYLNDAFGAGSWMDVKASGYGPTSLFYKHSRTGDAGGLGINSRRGRVRGEIDYHESMFVRFSRPVTLNSVDLAFLRYERNRKTGRKYQERGYLRIYREGLRPINVPFGHGHSSYFTVNNSGGIYSLLFGEMEGVKGVRFFSWKPRPGENHDYAVHGFHINSAAAPEPGAMLLLGSAMGMLGFIRRRRQAA